MQVLLDSIPEGNVAITVTGTRVVAQAGGLSDGVVRLV